MTIPAYDDINWSHFPQIVKFGDKNWTPDDYIRYQDEFESPDDYDELENFLYFAFHWDAWDGLGQYISFGIMYGYPKCCIYGFTFAWSTLPPDQKEQSRMALIRADLATENRWILCETCATYVQSHGIKAYLQDYAPTLDRDYSR